MKFDRHGIRFNLWLFYVLFTVGVVAVLGILQFSLIRPYYRNSKIETVKDLSNQISENLMNEKSSSDFANRSFKLAIENNVCAVIYNQNGKLLYSADSLGSGCVFNYQVSTNSEVDFHDPEELRSLLNESDGEISINVTNLKTQHEMIVYGKTLSTNLSKIFLYINSPLEPIDSIIGFFSHQYIIYTIFVVVIASVISFVLSSQVAKPIVRITYEADKLARTDYSANFDGGSFTETKELANTLNGATEKLSKIEELRKDLIANVSHDIKTPLTSIKAYAEMIKDISGDIPEKREEHLDVIINEADYLNKLVVDMRELSLMQNGRYMLKLQNFDLVQTIITVLKLNNRLIAESGLNVFTDMPDQLIVYADSVKITQVINNFLSNAIKHTPVGKSIFITTNYNNADEESIYFSIRDEGEGISEEELPYIWDRYQKSSKSFSRSLSSTGLGLSIVKAILDSHNAEYGVESEVGNGSTFWFKLNIPREISEISDE